MPTPGRADEEEGAQGPVRVGEPRAVAPDRVGDRLDRRLLAHDPLLELGLEVDVLLRLGGQHLGERECPVQVETTRAMSSSETSSRRSLPSALSLLSSVAELVELLLRLEEPCRT